MDEKVKDKIIKELQQQVDFHEKEAANYRAAIAEISGGASKKGIPKDIVSPVSIKQAIKNMYLQDPEKGIGLLEMITQEAAKRQVYDWEERRGLEQQIRNAVSTLKKEGVLIGPLTNLRLNAKAAVGKQKAVNKQPVAAGKRGRTLGGGIYTKAIMKVLESPETVIDMPALQREVAKIIKPKTPKAKDVCIKRVRARMSYLTTKNHYLLKTTKGYRRNPDFKM